MKEQFSDFSFNKIWPMYTLLYTCILDTVNTFLNTLSTIY